MRQVARTALGIVLLVDVLRVFLPSLITIFGQAGGTPAELIGLYALAWFLGAYVAVGIARVLGPARLAIGAAVLLVVGRAVLQFTDGGFPQLYVASGALLAGLSWLIAIAVGVPDARSFATGLVWGLAIATAVHAGLDTIDLVWREGVLPAAAVALIAVAFLALVLRPGVSQAADPGSEAEPAVTAPRFWLAVGPAVLLWGLYTGNTAHAQATAGWQPTVAAALVAAATFIAALIVERPRLWGSPWISAAALAASGVAFGYGEVTVDGVHGVAPWWTVVAQVVGALALAGCLGFAAERQASRDRGLRRGLLLATGFLLFVVFVFAYYAAYDLFLPNDYVPFVVAAVVGLVGAVGRTVLRPVRRQWWPALAGAVAAVLAVVAVPVWRPAPAVATGNGDGLRVAAYNIRMGFGLAGTFTVPEQADILRGLNADVIVLSEVDRAWFLNGGHDDLGLIASRLGMQFVWAPAADEVWGDALLTRLPITRVRNHVLVQGGPTGAQALEVGLRWQEREITVIATHLQPPSGWRELDQVEQLAAIVRAAAKPTIVAGDLNLQPGDRAWSVLIAAGLTDPLASVRPFVTIPTPGDAEQIDHILVTPGFTGADQANPDLPASDHRPIAVTLAAA